LASGRWYRTELPRAEIKALLRRCDGPGIRDSLIWFASLAVFGTAIGWLWSTVWVLPALICYGVLYGSASDARWHETGHGTAFKTAWMNDVIYQVASFMLMREPTIWRWSHARHHTDTIIVGRDPEIGTMRPADLARMAMAIFGIRRVPLALLSLGRHALGSLTAEEASYVPAIERARVFNDAQILLAVHLAVVAVAIALHSWLPVVLVGPLPSMYGGWLSYYLAVTQHTALEENALDHRVNTRTIYVNPILGFLYWNMNYHIEHHMFPMVPYHRLPALHRAVRHDLPTPYRSAFQAYVEIVRAIARQRRDPEWYIRRELPPTAKAFQTKIVQVAAE
jgi:fatty acid desaturase